MFKEIDTKYAITTANLIILGGVSYISFTRLLIIRYIIKG